MIDRDRKIKLLEDRNRELEKQVSYYEGYIDCMKDVFMDVLPIDTEVITLDEKCIEELKKSHREDVNNECK